jgi:hypothetical protein
LRLWGAPPPAFAKKRLENVENKEHERSKERKERRRMAAVDAVLK